MSFNIINKRRKIVRICKDVIQQVNVGQLAASHGMFFRNRIFVIGEKTKPAKKTIDNFLKNNKGRSCEVCAKGAMTVAWIRRFNHYNTDELWQMSEQCDDLPKELIDIFGKEMLDCIESAFEGGSYTWHVTRPMLSTKFTSFFKTLNCDGDRYDNADLLLKTIMQNIIDNKGRFVFNGISVGV